MSCEVEWSFKKSNSYKRKRKPTLQGVYTHPHPPNGMMGTKQDGTRCITAHIPLERLLIPLRFIDVYIFTLYRCSFCFFFLSLSQKVHFSAHPVYLTWVGLNTHLRSIPLQNSRGRNQLVDILRNKRYQTALFLAFFFLELWYYEGVAHLFVPSLTFFFK